MSIPSKEQIGNVMREAQSGQQDAGEAGTPSLGSDKEARTEITKNLDTPEGWTDSNSEQEAKPDNRSPVDQISEILSGNSEPESEEISEINPPLLGEAERPTAEEAEFESLGAPQIPITPEQEANAYAQEVMQAKQNLYQAQNDPELAQLQIDNPGAAANRIQEIKNYSEQIQEAERYVGQMQYQAQQTQEMDFINRRNEEAIKLIPAWSNIAVRKKQVDGMAKHFRDSGFSQNQIAFISASDMAMLQLKLFPQKQPRKLSRAQAGKVKPKPLRTANQNKSKVGQVGDVLSNAGVGARR